MKLESGGVSLATIDQLGSYAAELRRHDADLTQQRAALESRAASLECEAGAVLLGRRSVWDTAECASELADVDRLKAQIDGLDHDLANLTTASHGTLGRILHAFTDRVAEAKLGASRDELAAEMASALRRLVATAPQRTLPEADAARRAAEEVQRQVSDLGRQLEEDAGRRTAVEAELQQRQASVKQMGFDALYLAAYLESHGPDPVSSPLVLKRGEGAWLSIPAQLGRQKTRTNYVGGSQGFSFPIGHTGIRYRVGSYRGHAVQQQYLAKIDTGTLVLTNQRLAFVGVAKATTVPLAKILHVECYQDALAVFPESRETPDFYFVGNPRHLLFLLNWALSKSPQ